MRILDYPGERENVQENNKFVLFYVTAWGFRGGTVVKNCLPIQKIRVHFLGQGRSHGVGNSNPLQYSYLENSMDRGAWWATVLGVTKSWTQHMLD